MQKQHKEINNCNLCNRYKPVAEHHLFPVTVHKTKGFIKKFGKERMRTSKVRLCFDCHRYIHDSYDEKTLAREFHSLEALQREERIQKFISFVRKKH